MPMKRCFHAEGTIFSSNRNLPDQRTIQMFLYFVRRHTMPEQEHQLGNRTFGRAVVTAHHAGLQQFATGFIAVHFHAPGKALGDIDNDDPPFDRILQHLQQPAETVPARRMRIISMRSVPIIILRWHMPVFRLSMMSPRFTIRYPGNR